nr:iron-containing alcohol dehydrogenase family protein [uncultured Enterobacter sp.]
MLSITSPAAYLQQPGLRNRTGEYVKPLATVIHIFTSPRAWQAVNPGLTQSLESAGIRWTLAYLDGECSDAAIAQLRDNVTKSGAQGILAIGGGRVLDCAKAAAEPLAGVKLINFATLAATCAAWSPFAVIYNEQGAHQYGIVLTKMPDLVLVDSEVIARADVRYLKAGIVDALAKWFEFDPYQRHNPARLALDLKVTAARRAVEVYEQFGDEALAANEHQRVTPGLERVIEANIVLAGLANSIQDDLPTPGVAHAIHNRLTHEPALHDLLHGEKVGYSLLIQSLLERDGQVDEHLLALLRHYGSPLTLTALGEHPQAAFGRIAGDIHFPAASAANLPFAITAQKLERAFLQTVQAEGGLQTALGHQTRQIDQAV